MQTLIISNCQNDFITASAKVKGAKTLLTNIFEHIISNKNDIDKIVFIIDWNDDKEKYCVKYTPGSCIESKIFKLVIRCKIPYEIIEKDSSETNIIYDVSYSKDYFGTFCYLNNLVSINIESDLVLCGFVSNDIKTLCSNLLDNSIKPKILTKGTPQDIQSYIKENDIKTL